MRTRFLASIALVAVASFAACSTKRIDTEADPEPLKLGEAPSALCGSAAREGDDENGSGTGPAGPGSSASSGYGVGGSYHGGGYGPQGGGGYGGCPEGGAGGLGGGCSEGGSDQGGSDQGGSNQGGSNQGGTDAGGFGGSANAAPGAQTQSMPSACLGLDMTKPLDLYVSADDSNSMAAPVIARSQINAGMPEVEPWTVRTYEFLNYYRFGFDKPEPGKLAITSQLGSCVLSGDVALQVAVQSAPFEAERPNMTVTLVLDTSGSMQGEPIALEKAAVRAIASSLQPGDVVNAVTWSVDQTPVLAGHIATGPDDPAVVQLAESIEAGGGTDLEGGLSAGYQLAKANYLAGGINRVVIISDGQANVGITAEELIGDNAKDEDQAGIYLVGVGVGEGVNDTMMNVVTDAGRGAYVFLDRPDEAHHMFVERFGETMQVAARDVRVKLSLPPYFAIHKFYGEEYSPDPDKVRPQHLAPDDAFILYQILRPCDPSLPSASDPFGVTVTWQDPVTGEAKEVQQNTTLGNLAVDDGNLTKAAAVVAYAEALKELPLITGADERISLLKNTAELVGQSNPGNDADLDEIAGLLAKLIDNQ